MTATNPGLLDLSDSVLPDGWGLSHLSEVCRINPPKISSDSLEPDQPVTFVPMPAVDADKGAITAPQERRFSDVRKGFTSFQDDDVIMAKITPCMENGKAAVASGLTNGLGFGSTEFHVLRSNGAVMPRFLYHFVRQESFRRAAESQMTGSVGQKRVPTTFLEQSELPLPPLSEQRRIVEKVEQLLASVNAARERLVRVPDILKRFRQAVLIAACSGRLTADWRARTPVENIAETLKRVRVPPSKTGREATDNIIPGVCILSVGNPHSAAPSGWRWTPLIEIAKLESGHTPSRKHPEYWGGKIPWIGILDAGAHHGGFILHTKQTVTQLGLENSAARLLPPRTVCLSRTASVGYAVIMGRTMATSQDFVNWVCSDALVPEFLMYALMAEGEDIKRFGRGTTHTTIYFPEVKAIHICLPSVSEQHEIVRRVDTLFELSDLIEKRVATATARTEKLTQAILAKAFRGELVPTEAELARHEGRAYESASDLLARIQSERAALIEREGVHRKNGKRLRPKAAPPKT